MNEKRRSINNELILMKKTIQQAKVCVIGKLVRKLKDVKGKLEKEPKSMKLNARATKITEQINYLKHIHNLTLASLALTAPRNCQEKILTNPLSSIEELALAHITTFKAIKLRVQQIKDKYSLDDESAEWRESIREIGKKKKLKQTMAEKKKRNSDRKEEIKKTKEIRKKRSEWLTKNIVKPDGSDDGESDNSGDDDEEETDKREEETEKEEEIILKPKIIKKVIKTSEQKPKNKFKNRPVKTIDSFFITPTGENYMATAIVDRVQLNQPNDGLDRKERRAQKFGKSTKTPSNKRKPETETLSAKRNFQNSTRNDSKPIAAVAPTNLHPSWLAKQKQKGIEQFEGKKITFSDCAEPVGKTPPFVPTIKSDVPAPNLHPSWAAKQKLKPVISEFKGIKIMFNED